MAHSMQPSVKILCFQFKLVNTNLSIITTLDHPNFDCQSDPKTHQTLIFLAKSEVTRRIHWHAAPPWRPKSVHPALLCMQQIVQNTILFAFWNPRGNFLMPMVTHKHLFMQFLVKTRNHQFCNGKRTFPTSHALHCGA